MEPWTVTTMVLAVRRSNNSARSLSNHSAIDCGGIIIATTQAKLVPPKGVGPRATLAWPGWKQPDIPVEVDTDRLETSRMEAGVISLAGIAKLSRLKYR